MLNILLCYLQRLEHSAVAEAYRQDHGTPRNDVQNTSLSMTQTIDFVILK